MRKAWVVVVVLGVLCGVPATASAGTYMVQGGCGNWEAQNPFPGQIVMDIVCPGDGFAVRNIGGVSSFNGNSAQWRFVAPQGTTIQDIWLSGDLLGSQGWLAQGYVQAGNVAGQQVFKECPGATCGAGDHDVLGHYSGGGAAEAYLRILCVSQVCSSPGVSGQINVRSVQLILDDRTSPSIRVTGGDATGQGWQRGVRDVLFEATDNTGIREARVRLDGEQVATFGYFCRFGPKVPCAQGAGAVPVNTGRLSDGRHTLVVQATDGTGNPTTSPAHVILTDNTPPTQPRDVTSDANNAWRSINRFRVSWNNPPQVHAPIAGPVFMFCPTPDATTEAQGCVRQARNAADVGSLDDVQVPSPGDWTMRMSLADQAGNNDPATAVVVRGLRFDPEPPSLALVKPDPKDPARLRVRASDATSGVARGIVERRRKGTKTWRPIETKLGVGGFNAFMDDSRLRAGTYDVRARAADHAGNESGTDRFEDGKAAMVRVPLRRPTRMVVGKARRVRRGGRRVTVFNTRPRVRFGRTVRLRGRLTRPRRGPIRRARIEVSERVDLRNARWRQVATLRTSRTGRFSYRAPRGQARRLRFRYAGTNLVRGRINDVDVRVMGTTSMRVSSKRAVNGGSVIFRGRLRGRPVPETGKLVELQVFTRGRWRTFAQPRASARTGRWAFRYRFEAIRGNVIFRFRARIRREAGYPYELGTSRQVAVRVRGQ